MKAYILNSLMFTFSLHQRGNVITGIDRAVVHAIPFTII